MANTALSGLFGGSSELDVLDLMRREQEAKSVQARAFPTSTASIAAAAQQEGKNALKKMFGGVAGGLGLDVAVDPRLAKARKTETDKREIMGILQEYATDGFSEEEMRQGYALLMRKGYPEEARKFLADAKMMVDMDRSKAAAAKDRMGPGGGKPQKGRVWMLENGEQLKGVTVFQGGVEYVQKADGSKEPIPDGAREITPGMLKNAMLKQDKFLEIKTNILKDVQSIKRLTVYAEGVSGSKQGLSLLTDGFIASLKTLTGKKLTDSQLKTLIQKGDFNALIGRFRKEIVGGGVMTEPDAKRIMLALGDDISAWRNKAVVGEQLRKLFQDKLDYIKNNVEDYNNQVGWPGRGNLPKIKVPEFSMKAFDDLTDTNTKKTKKNVPQYISVFKNGVWVNEKNPDYEN